MSVIFVHGCNGWMQLGMMAWICVPFCIQNNEQPWNVYKQYHVTHLFVFGDPCANFCEPPLRFSHPHQLLAFRPKNLKLLDVECALLTFLVIDTVAWFSAISPARATQHITEEGTVVDLTKRFLRLPKWLVHHHHHCFLFKWSLNALSEVKMKWSACEKADIAKFWGMYHLKQYSKVVKWVELMSWMESPYVSFPS